MERSDFLKKGFSFLGMAVIAPSLLGADKASAACTVANTETAGPFPTLTPASLVRSNITGARTGIPFTITINVKNVNDACNALSGVIVDIWHCDKDGNYSQYGGTSMQPTDYTAYDFLRGRQTTNSAGQVVFTSIFPGWYTSRATHIHVHVYTASGTSLLISQIAFPEGSGSAVETVNSATAYGYTKGMSGYTYNSADNVFNDGTATEMSSITGSVAAGYVLTWDAFVSGSMGSGLLVDDVDGPGEFQLRRNFPNPCADYTRIPIVLKTTSEVRVSILTIDGREMTKQVVGNLPAGEQTIDIDTSMLQPGSYIFSVKVSNMTGTYSQSKLFTRM